MPSCISKRKDGSPCGSSATADSEYCKFHRDKHARRLVHGNSAKSVPGVPKKYHGFYQDFLDSPKPFDLTREMALLRALFIELRDVVDDRAPIKVDKAAAEIVERVDCMVNYTEQQEAAILAIFKVVEQQARIVIRHRFGMSASSADDIKALSELLLKVVKAAEIMKKIQEGVKLEVSIDTHMLVKIVQMAIFPFVPEDERRQKIIQALSVMSVPTAPREEHVALPENLGGEVGVEPCDMYHAERPRVDEAKHPFAVGVGGSGAGFFSADSVPGRPAEHLLSPYLSPY